MERRVMAVNALIIDGYNLMHAAGLACVRYGPGELEKRRDRLIGLLANALSTEARSLCTVVFDAFESPAHGVDRTRQSGIAIVFAQREGEADAVIETLIATHPTPGQLVVVSGDRRLHLAAKRRKVRAVDSDEFLRNLNWETTAPKSGLGGVGEKTSGKVGVDTRRTNSSAPSTGSRDERAQAAGTDDVAYWMEQFGDVDVQPRADELPRRASDAIDLQPLRSARTPAAKVHAPPTQTELKATSESPARTVKRDPLTGRAAAPESARLDTELTRGWDDSIRNLERELADPAAIERLLDDGRRQARKRPS